MKSEKMLQRKVKRFTPEDDSLIRKYCNKYTIKNAVKKLSSILERSERSIRERFTKFLALNCEPFTKEEDQTILEMQAQFGNKWKLIASYLHSRSDIQTRIRYKQLKKEIDFPENSIPNDNPDDFNEIFGIEEIPEFDFNDFCPDF